MLKNNTYLKCNHVFVFISGTFLYIDPKERKDYNFSQGKIVKYLFSTLLRVINSYLLIVEDQSSITLLQIIILKI